MVMKSSLHFSWYQIASRTSVASQMEIAYFLHPLAPRSVVQATYYHQNEGRKWPHFAEMQVLYTLETCVPLSLREPSLPYRD
jgi:hypothetical protein